MDNNALTQAIYNKVAPLPASPASEATSQLILAAIGGSGISFFTDHTQAGPAERDGLLGFALTATDIGTGPIPAVDINIAAISALMEKSVGGAAFSSVGITQPIFTKALGLVLTAYQFLAAEWAIGDMYRLTVTGVTASVGVVTFYIDIAQWSNVITSFVNLDAKISTRATQAQILSDATPFPGANIPATLAEATIVEDHLHNREYWFGKAAAPTATHFADRVSLTPFIATSGAGDFGTDPGDTANVLGPDDTPVRVGDTRIDVRRISIFDVSTAQFFYLRFIWGTPLQTEAVAEAAGQYTEITVQQQTAAGQNRPQDLIFERIPAGYQVWARAKCSVNNAFVSFMVGVHEYPAP